MFIPILYTFLGFLLIALLVVFMLICSDRMDAREKARQNMYKAQAKWMRKQTEEHIRAVCGDKDGNI